MNQPIGISRVELIQMVGETILWLDVTRSGLARQSADRIALDNLRDQLDSMQRIFVRNALHSSSDRYDTLSATLEAINDELTASGIEAADFAARLELLVRFVGVAQKLAWLA